MACDIRLSKVDRVYSPGDIVSGVVVVNSKGGISHSGIKVTVDGEVTLQLSARSVGLFEAFYNSLKPIKLVDLKIDIAKSGKLPDGITELPFEFKLEPMPDVSLYETYHGVFVNIQYVLTVDITRPVMYRNLQKKLEFIVEVRTKEKLADTPVEFTIEPDNLENVKKSSLKKIPRFKIVGKLENACCYINKPLLGHLAIEESDAEIKSIELQLVRVETCGCADGFAKEATEIQNIQIADGNVAKGLKVPIYMVFPRLFTCPTVAARTFKIEFEVNLVVMLQDGHLISENFPIRLIRM